jgi:hypothetical protein
MCNLLLVVYQWLMLALILMVVSSLLLLHQAPLDGNYLILYSTLLCSLLIIVCPLLMIFVLHYVIYLHNENFELQMQYNYK